MFISLMTKNLNSRLC